jgi:hypothetical protein
LGQPNTFLARRPASDQLGFALLVATDATGRRVIKCPPPSFGTCSKIYTVILEAMIEHVPMKVGT